MATKDDNTFIDMATKDNTFTSEDASNPRKARHPLTHPLTPAERAANVREKLKDHAANLDRYRKAELAHSLATSELLSAESSLACSAILLGCAMQTSLTPAAANAIVDAERIFKAAHDDTVSAAGEKGKEP